MDHRLRLLSIALFACLWASGCCCYEDRVWRCPDGGCGLLSGRNSDCGDGSACNDCGRPLGSCICHPFQAMGRHLTCGKGCGDVYWDEWHSDPPDPCDPCDDCYGNFVGPRCCPLPWHRRTTNMLLGRRCCTMNCNGYCDGGCGPEGCGPGGYEGEEVVMSGPATSAPMLAPQLAPPRNVPAPRKAVPRAAAPQPSPTPADEAPMLNAPEARRRKPTMKTTAATKVVGSGLRR